MLWVYSCIYSCCQSVLHVLVCFSQFPFENRHASFSQMRCVYWFFFFFGLLPMYSPSQLIFLSRKPKSNCQSEELKQLKVLNTNWIGWFAFSANSLNCLGNFNGIFQLNKTLASVRVCLCVCFFFTLFFPTIYCAHCAHFFYYLQNYAQHHDKILFNTASFESWKSSEYRT